MIATTLNTQSSLNKAEKGIKTHCSVEKTSEPISLLKRYVKKEFGSRFTTLQGVKDV